MILIIYDDDIAFNPD